MASLPVSRPETQHRARRARRQRKRWVRQSSPFASAPQENSESSPPHLVCCSATATATATQYRALLKSSQRRVCRALVETQCRLKERNGNIRHRRCWACVVWLLSFCAPLLLRRIGWIPGSGSGSWGQKLRMMRQCTETQLDGKEEEKPAAIRCRMK